MLFLNYEEIVCNIIEDYVKKYPNELFVLMEDQPTIGFYTNKETHILSGKVIVYVHALTGKCDHFGMKNFALIGKIIKPKNETQVFTIKIYYSTNIEYDQVFDTIPNIGKAVFIKSLKFVYVDDNAVEFIN